MEWSANFNQVQQVTGSLGYLSTANAGIKMSAVAAHPVNKIIQGDWDWQYNRNTSLTTADWHNNPGDRKNMMLWGDSHVSFYQFPTNIMESEDITPNPNYDFW